MYYVICIIINFLYNKRALRALLGGIIYFIIYLHNAINFKNLTSTISEVSSITSKNYD